MRRPFSAPRVAVTTVHCRSPAVRRGLDVVHGHSSHHPLGIEACRQRLTLCGCGDFLSDYEGIAGYERYRPDLTLMYLPLVDAATGRLGGSTWCRCESGDCA